MLYAYLISGLPEPQEIAKGNFGSYKLCKEPSFVCDSELFNTIIDRAVTECFLLELREDKIIALGIGWKEVNKMWEILEEEGKGFLTEDIKDSELRIERIQREVKESPTQYAWYLCLREEVRLDDGLCLSSSQVCS